MATISCYANVRGDRIQLLIRKGERGYSAFAKVLAAIEKKGFVSWYGDVCDGDGNEQCGLIITAAGLQKKRVKRARHTAVPCSVCGSKRTKKVTVDYYECRNCGALK